MANSQSTLEILLQIQDLASKAVADASTNITNSLGNIQSKASNVALTFGAVGVGMLAPLGLAVSAAEESQKVYTQLQAVLASTGGAAGVTAEKAVELSKALEHQTTFSDEAVLSTENLLLTFTNIKDNIFPDATKAVLDMSVALGEDTKDASIQLGKALQDPILGITALRRVGVNFNDDQKAVIKNLVETGHSLDAQKMILKELSTEFGGSAAAAATTFEGRMTQLKERTNDMQEKIGTALIPALEKFVEVVGPIVEKMTEWIDEHPKLTAGIIGTVAAVGSLLVVIATIAGAIWSTTKAIEAAKDAAVLFGATLDFLAANPVVLIIAGIVALGFAIYELIQHWDQVKKFTEKTWNELKSILLAVWDTLKANLDVFLSAVTTAWNNAWGGVKDFFIGVWDTIKNDLQSAIDWVSGKLNQLWDTVQRVTGVITNPIKTVGDTVSGIIAGAGKLIGGAVSTASSVIGIHDAIITPGGQVIQSDPADFLIATKTPGSLVGSGSTGNITINIQGGNYYTDRQNITDMANQLAKIINMQIKVRNYAS